MTPEITAALLDELYLLGRGAAYEKVGQVLDGRLNELCIQTRHPKQVSRFIAACLARRGELEAGAGERCFFIRDKETWEEMCSAIQPSGQILIAEPELDLAGLRGELLPKAWQRAHSVIYSLTNPRPDTKDTVVLGEPREHEVREVLERHGFTRVGAEKLANQSNRNVYLLGRLLVGTAERPAWLTEESAYSLRGLALLGGWDDGSDLDREAVAKIIGESYDQWSNRVLPLTRRNDPPLLLEGRVFRPASIYENWQLLSPQLADADLRRFTEVAKEVLADDEREDELDRERFLVRREQISRRYSSSLRKQIAEALALLAAQGGSLNCSPNLSNGLVDDAVRALLVGQSWLRWASLAQQLPRLAEASPNCFLSALENALGEAADGVISRLFAERENWFSPPSYHPHLLWALETLAWLPEHLVRVCLILTHLAKMTPMGNSGNTAAGTLSSIFLPWLPQTLATIDGRRVAVECVIREDEETGWQLLLALLPQSHQTGSYNAKPVWRDWIPVDWTEGVTHGDYRQQALMYSELAVNLALEDIKKFKQIIGRYEDLPRSISAKLLDFLHSKGALDLAGEDRYSLWETLSGKVRRHRKYASTDWALPEVEVRKIESAAEAIKPVDPLFEKRWLFNAYDHELFETDDYRVEVERVAALREEAARVVLIKHGPDGLVGMVAGVSQPRQLGSAAARAAGLQLDAEYLPRLLGESDPKLNEFVRGFVWRRFFMESLAWVLKIGTEAWYADLRVKFLSYLPFCAEIWRFAEENLGARTVDYWDAIWPNVFQAEGDLQEAAEKAIEFQRPEISIDCLQAMLFNGMEVPVELAVKALEEFVRSGKAIGHAAREHDLLEVLKFVQNSPAAPEGRVAWIEFHCVAMLDRLSSGRPIFLERHLARDPNFFHEIITYCYRSRHDPDQSGDVGSKVEFEGALRQEELAQESLCEQEAADHKKALAVQAYRLLDLWATPPGTNEEGSAIDEELFLRWFERAKEICEKSGHWEIAQQQLGQCLMTETSPRVDDGYRPKTHGLDRLLEHPRVAKALDAADCEEVRRGMTLALFNNRGVHGFSAGEEERKIADKFRGYAKRFEEAIFPRIAMSLRDLAASYDWEAEREKKRDEYL